MIFKTEQLKAVMDNIRNDPALAPIKTQYGLTTFCNLNAYRIAQALGFNIFHNYDADRPMLANEMIYFMDIKPEVFSKFSDHALAHNLVNKGYLIFAAQKGEIHGHIAPVYPYNYMLISGKWRCQVPYISNVGERNGVIGVNWAFAKEPNYYIIL